MGAIAGATLWLSSAVLGLAQQRDKLAQPGIRWTEEELRRAVAPARA